MLKHTLSNNKISAKDASHEATDKRKNAISQSPKEFRSVVSTLCALLRGPVLWLCGVSVLASACILFWEQMPHRSLIPLIFFTVFGGVALWTTLCFLVWSKDIYTCIVQPLLLEPALISAAQYSMDNIFRVLFDPTQLATYLSACWMVPVSLYAIPTTEQQRVQVLSAAGVLPSGQTDRSNSQIFTQPGGWVSLLPETIQQVVLPILPNADDHVARCDQDHCGSRRYCAASAVLLKESLNVNSPLHPQDVTSASTVDEDEEYDDIHDGRTSPQGVPNITSNNVRGGAFTDTSIPSSRLSLEMSSSAPFHEHELPELFFQIWMDVLQKKWDRICNRLQEQRSNMAITAMVTCTVLWLQMRYSPTARKIVRNVVHILLTTSAGITLLGSTAAFLTPYLYERWQQHLRPNTRINPNDVSYDFKHLSILISSLVSSLGTAIPTSVPITKEFAKKMERFFRKWKGTVAVFVLAYFRYQHCLSRKQKLRKEI